MIENIILTEDDSDDVMFFEVALQAIKYPFAPQIARSCEELFNAIDDMVNLPDVIFLDLNMPGKNGFECLKLIRDISVLNSCKVVVLTTSNDERDKEKCLSLGANMFVTKPSEISELASLLQSIVMQDEMFVEGEGLH